MTAAGKPEAGENKGEPKEQGAQIQVEVESKTGHEPEPDGKAEGPPKEVGPGALLSKRIAVRPPLQSGDKVGKSVANKETGGKVGQKVERIHKWRCGEGPSINLR